jgi:ABC-type cobalamin/Fe3+-siderophores transport system ATPase subunit
MIQIKIPDSKNNGTISYELNENLVIVGSNGSGKSRFGSTIEQSNEKTKRISAQRYLQMEEIVQLQSYENAKTTLSKSYKNQAPIIPQNDFQQVLISLFAQESSRNENVVADVLKIGSISKEKIPSSTKENVLDVWNFVFPQRPLRLEKEKVSAINKKGQSFSGNQMSDGEKVGLYLIAQVLLAEENSILIIDEPELHLHKALMVRLWNKLENFRNDCIFIYITHDLDFAVGKLSSKIIWIKDYDLDNNIWEWKELEDNKIIPHDLFLQVLGSRKPIIFSEGTKGSLDQKLYQAFYEGFTIIPRESCDKVIESVKGLRENIHLHDKEVFGLIDLDFKSQEHIDSLKSKYIYAINVNIIENIFLVPEIIVMVCDYLGKQGSYEQIINRIRSTYKLQRDRIEFSAKKSRIHRFLGERFGSVKNKEELEKFNNEIIDDIKKFDVDFKLPDENSEIEEILKFYPHKGLVKLIQVKLGLKGTEYNDLVFSFFANKKCSEVKKVLSKYLPEITINKL